MIASVHVQLLGLPVGPAGFRATFTSFLVFVFIKVKKPNSWTRRQRTCCCVTNTEQLIYLSISEWTQTFTPSSALSHNPIFDGNSSRSNTSRLRKSIPGNILQLYFVTSLSGCHVDLRRLVEDVSHLFVPPCWTPNRLPALTCWNR